MTNCDPTISAIVAKAKHHVIGCNGDMPWRMPSDLRYFRKLTIGKPCIMGRKTWESLPGALKNRANLVLTRQVDFNPDGAEVFHSIEDIVNRAKKIACTSESVDPEIMVIGGGEIYRQFLPICDKVYITRIDASLEGDTTFPMLSAGTVWDLVSSDAMRKYSGDQFRAERKIYERKKDLFSVKLKSTSFTQDCGFKKLAIG